MIRADFFIEAMSKAGFGLFTGVPCSYLTPFINTVIGSPHIHYIPAANEGDAVAIACGAELGGRRAVVMFQNSGLGNAVSPLTSLTSTFRLPVLVITTWRGQPGGPADEPQHETMGRITPALLELMSIPWELFPSEESDIDRVLGRAVTHMQEHGTPYALVMPHGVVQAQDQQSTRDFPTNHREADSEPYCSDHLIPSTCDRASFTQDDVLRTIQLSVAESDAVLATTGFTGRALYALDDRPNQFYMVGSMGCISSLGLGLATVQPDRRVVVVDGDGAMLMRMGALATNGFQSPGNLIHIVLDNGCHDSTGAQFTVSSTMNFMQLALACGYTRAISISTLTDLSEALQASERGLTFVHVKTESRQNRKLPRPVVTPAEVATRFREWLAETSISTRTASLTQEHA
jgi:phosphonopyruvate decarboxylase